MRQLKREIPRIKESWNGDCLFEIQAIHRKCIRLLIITAHFNLRSRPLKLRLLTEGVNWSPPIQHLSLLTDLCFNHEWVFKVSDWMAVLHWTFLQTWGGEETRGSVQQEIRNCAAIFTHSSFWVTLNSEELQPFCAWLHGHEVTKCHLSWTLHH